MRLKIHDNFILAACVFALVAICFASIYRPMRFKEEQKIRERVVMERILKIRKAEERYLKANGTYAGDFATLVKGGYIADSLTYIPYSDNERFELRTTTEITKSGQERPQMGCGAQYHQYLRGLDENSIANLIENANDSGEYPGVKTGDL